MLDKIKSLKKQEEILKILNDCEPRNEQRLYLVGFLKFVGYTLTEVMKIIRDNNSWLDYREKTTYYFVQNIFKSAKMQVPKNVALQSEVNVHTSDLLKSFYLNLPIVATDVCTYERELKKYYGEV